MLNEKEELSDDLTFMRAMCRFGGRIQRGATSRNVTSSDALRIAENLRVFPPNSCLNDRRRLSRGLERDNGSWGWEASNREDDREIAWALATNCVA